jgi:cold-inducible RNA-binding protein
MENNKIYVGSLAMETTQETLRAAFEKFGAIDEVNLIKDRFTGESKGFAFVKFESNASASKALDMNGKALDKWTIRVSLATKKKPFNGSQRKW